MLRLKPIAPAGRGCLRSDEGVRMVLDWKKLGASEKSNVHCGVHRDAGPHAVQRRRTSSKPPRPPGIGKRVAVIGGGVLGLGSAMYLGCTTMNPSVPAASRRTVSSQADARHVAVVGGGFVGLSCALHLQRSGYKVTLFDSSPLAGPASASFGNAGTFAMYASVPVNRPGLWKDVPGMLVSGGALSILPTPHLLTMVPWFARFLLACRPAEVEKTSMALASLLLKAEPAYAPVLHQAGVDLDEPMGVHASSAEAEALPFAQRRGYLLLQRTEAIMAGSLRGVALRRQGLGDALRIERLTTEQVLELEPALAPSAAGGGAWFFPDAWCLRDPGALLRALHRGFEAGGGQVRAGESCKVEALCDGPSGGVLLDLAGGRAQDGGREAEFGHVVIAAGAHSAALAASVGDSVPLDTERGYHVVFPAGTEQRLTRAVCDPSEGFIMTPMSGGLRAAGRVELGGVQAPATPGRCDGLERAAASLFADALPSREPGRDWLGFRPTLPDALPVIGRSPRDARVVYAFGHQHVGWTLGGITGQLVAELVAGEAPSVDIAPFSVERFRWL